MLPSAARLRADGPFRPLLPAFLGALLAASVGRAAAPPRDELLRLVPPDAGFCLVVQDVRRHAGDWQASDFRTRFLASPLGKHLADAPQLRQLADVEKFLKDQLGVSWPKVRDDLVGDAVVYAYQPGPADKPEREQGLALTWVRDPALLANVLDRLNAAQKKSGELKSLTALEHNGRTYYRRTKKVGGDEYYYSHEKVFAFSAQQAVIEGAIDRHRAATPTDAPPALAQNLRKLGLDRSLAVLWVNARALERELIAKKNAARGAEAAFLSTFLKTWEGLEGMALFVTVGEQLEVGVAVQAKSGARPPLTGRLFTGEAAPSALWSVFPADALFAVAGHVDVVEMVEAGGQFLTEEARTAVRKAVEQSVGAALGKDKFWDVLAAIGPEWGVLIAAPPAGDKKDWLPHGLAALRVRNKPAGTDRAALDALNFFVRLGVLAYNNMHSDQVQLQTVDQDGVEVRYLTNDRVLPPGVRPAFALKGGYLVVASSPGDIQRFAPPKPKAPAAAREVPLLRWSLRYTAAYLKAQREPLAKALAADKSVAMEEAGRGLDEAIQTLALFDRLELNWRGGVDHATLFVRLVPAPAPR